MNIKKYILLSIVSSHLGAADLTLREEMDLAAKKFDCDSVVQLHKEGALPSPDFQHNVAYCATIKQQWPLLERMLQHPDSKQWTNLLFQNACNHECVKLLANKRLNLNQRGNYGHTRLHHAVDRRDTKTVKALVEHGADATIKNNWGQTPAHIAAENIGEHTQVNIDMLIILQQAHRWRNLMHIKDREGNTAAGMINRLKDKLCSSPYLHEQVHCIELTKSLAKLHAYYASHRLTVLQKLESFN